MTEQPGSEKRKPNPEKVAFLRSLPMEVKQQITGFMVQTSKKS